MILPATHVNHLLRGFSLSKTKQHDQTHGIGFPLFWFSFPINIMVVNALNVMGKSHSFRRFCLGTWGFHFARSTPSTSIAPEILGQWWSFYAMETAKRIPFCCKKWDETRKIMGLTMGNRMGYRFQTIWSLGLKMGCGPNGNFRDPNLGRSKSWLTVTIFDGASNR